MGFNFKVVTDELYLLEAGLESYVAIAKIMYQNNWGTGGNGKKY